MKEETKKSQENNFESSVKSEREEDTEDQNDVLYEEESQRDKSLMESKKGNMNTRDFQQHIIATVVDRKVNTDQPPLSLDSEFVQNSSAPDFYKYLFNTPS